MAPHLYGHPHAQARAIEAARSNVETHYAYICVQVEEFQRRQAPPRWLFDGCAQWAPEMISCISLLQPPPCS